MEEYMEDNGVPESANLFEQNHATSACQLVRLPADSPPLDTLLSPQNLATPFRGRIFECLVCEYSTGNLDSLKRHNKCHKTETRKAFQCTLCTYSSNSKSSVSRHQKSYHQSHHLDAENENNDGIMEKDLDNMDEELYLQQSPDSPPHQETEICSTTESLEVEKSTLMPMSSSAGIKRSSLKKKKSTFSSNKKTLKKSIFGLSDKSRIIRSKSKLDKNDSVPHSCEIAAQSSEFEEDTLVGSDQHTMEGEENSMLSEGLGSSPRSLPDLEEDSMDYDEMGCCDSPSELEAMVDQNTSEDGMFLELVVNQESEARQRDMPKKYDKKSECFASFSGDSGGPHKDPSLPLDWKQDSLEHFKNQVEFVPQAQGSLLVDIEKDETPKAIPGNDLVTAIQDSTMDVVILSPHQSEAISIEQGTKNVEKSLQSGPNASMVLEKVDPSRDIQALDRKEGEEKEVCLETNAVSENDPNKQFWERSSQLLEAAAVLIKKSTALHTLATQILPEALPNRDIMDALIRCLQSVIGELDADIELDSITMKKSQAFLRKKQQRRCEIENKILQTRAIVDSAKEAIRAAEEVLAHLPEKRRALRFSIQQMRDRKSYLRDSLRIEWEKEIAALDTVTGSTSEGFATASAQRQITIDSLKKEAQQLETELPPLYQQENVIEQDEQRAGESFVAATEQLIDGNFVLKALQLELSTLANQDDESDKMKDLDFIRKKTQTCGQLHICLRDIKLLKFLSPHSEAS